VNTVHNICINAGYNSISIMKASIKVKLLTGVYMLQTTRSKFSNKHISASCPLYGSEDEDKIHFILKCPNLVSTRKYYIDELKSMLYEIDHDVSVNIVNTDELFIQLILDVTSESMHTNGISVVNSTIQHRGINERILFCITQRKM